MSLESQITEMVQGTAQPTVLEGELTEPELLDWLQQNVCCSCTI
jgi:hypothetical protein